VPLSEDMEVRVANHVENERRKKEKDDRKKK
jgi:hypothetical protein